MTYYSYYRWRVRLPLLAKFKTMTEETLLPTFLEVIENTLRMGNNPYKQALRAMEDNDLHNWRTILPEPETEEAMESRRNKERLAEWMLTTEETQLALELFLGRPPKSNPAEELVVWEVSEEAAEEMSVYMVLQELKLTEHD